MNKEFTSEQIKLRTRLWNKYKNEKVFVVPTEDLPAMVEGYVGRSSIVLPLLKDKGMFASRYEVEYNPRVRQPIPYVVVKYKDKYFGMIRLEGAGEARLHGKVTLGVGGHINPVDDKGLDIFKSAMWRELGEELNMPSTNMMANVDFIGIINDNSNDVSRDHLGLLYIFELINTNDISVRETDKHEGEWFTLEELIEIEDRLESWSQIVLSVLKNM